MSEGAVLGLQCKLYIGEAGANPPDTLVENVTSVTFSLSAGEADITTRKANGWRAYAATLKEGTCDFEMMYDLSDANFLAVRGAFLASSAISVLVGDDTGSGFLFDAVVTKFDVNQALEEGAKVAVTVRPTMLPGEQGRAPAWYSAAAGA